MQCDTTENFFAWETWERGVTMTNWRTNDPSKEDHALANCCYATRLRASVGRMSDSMWSHKSIFYANFSNFKHVWLIQKFVNTVGQIKPSACWFAASGIYHALDSDILSQKNLCTNLAFATY